MGHLELSIELFIITGGHLHAITGELFEGHRIGIGVQRYELTLG